MSETDDTDVLLLIPPNFFLVQSSGSEDSLLESSRTVVHKPASCTAQVLGKLVNQVQTLESRLESLEVTSTSEISSQRARRRNWDTDSFDSRSLDRKCFTFPRRRRRRQSIKRRNRDLSLTSLDSVSTSHRDIPHLKLNVNSLSCGNKGKVNDTLSMDGDISSVVSTPSKNNDKLFLHEIDEFLTKVESYEMPEQSMKDETLCPENIIKATGEYLSQKMEGDVKLPSGRVVSSAILDKYIYLVKNNSASSQTEKSVLSSYKPYSDRNESQICSEMTPKVTHDTSKTDYKSQSIRKLNFSENRDIQPTSTPKKLQPNANYLDSFKPSSNKIYDRATKVLEQYKSQNYSRNIHNSDTSNTSSPKKEEFKMPQMRPYVSENRETMKLAAFQNKLMDSIDTDLLSLSELWGEKGDKAERTDNIKLEEERLKREHCEAMIQQLQKKMLQQQEKLAVAMKVDRGKDAAIAKLREAWLKLTSSLDRAEERHRAALEKMVREVENFKSVADDAQKKTNHFEAELYKALDLAHDYQEKCKQITQEKKDLQHATNSSLATKDELIKAKECEIQVLKDNYDTVMRMNKQSTDCVKNLEESLEKERSEHEATKSRVSELTCKVQSSTEELTLMIQERDILKNKVNEERAKCDIMERQLTDKQGYANELAKKCDNLDNEVKSLRKHIELQKNELKSHYQRQLEDAVLGKLQEFQEQLDHAEREMESDSRAKETAIVDSYNKQIVRIEEQHKLEIKLLEEKQKEEMKLCRLQLAQSTEKIGLLENKLESYRRRRGELATQLHGVMESQWRQALLILTHGNSAPDTHDVWRPAGREYAPPKIPPLSPPGKRLERQGSALHLEALSDTELQQYVRLLLTKQPNMASGAPPAPPVPPAPPSVCEEPTSDRPDKQERRDSQKRSLSKPPWKA